MKVLRAIVAAVVLPAVSVYAVSELYYRGEFNSWGTTAMALSGGVWRVTIQAPSDDSQSEFKLAASDWSYEWTSQDTSMSLGVEYTAYTTGGNSGFNAVGNRYYTFSIYDKDSGDQSSMMVQETANSPITFYRSGQEEVSGTFDPADNVSDDRIFVENNINTIQLTFSATPSSGEKVYVRYTTDGWSSSSFVQANHVSGNLWSADIPAQSRNTTIEYYALSTTVTTPDHDDADLLTIRYNDEGVGNNATYTILDLGHSWHLPDALAGSSGDTMRDGGNLDGGINFDGTETQAKIYSGNTFQNFEDAADQSAYYLHWRVQGESWQVVTGEWNNTTVNDKYWLATINLSGVSSGSVVQYYLELQYTDASNTFIYAHDSTNTYISGFEDRAQAKPFQFNYGQPLGPGDAIPEPGTLSILLFAAATAGALRQRRR